MEVGVGNRAAVAAVVAGTRASLPCTLAPTLT